MAVRIRMKMMGRKHRPYFRIVAIDHRQPRDGRVIEELGTYDPMVKNTDERVKLKPERIKYWMSVGAKPSENVAVLHQEVHGQVRAEGSRGRRRRQRRRRAGPAADAGARSAAGLPCASTC